MDEYCKTTGNEQTETEAEAKAKAIIRNKNINQIFVDTAVVDLDID